MKRIYSLSLFIILATTSFAYAVNLEWTELPAVPDEQGFAGPFVGVSNDALIVAGGANFPKPIWETEKAWHDDIFVLEEPDGKWVKAGKLPRALGYGVSINYGDELICIGGDDAEQPYADVFALKWDGTSIVTRTLPSLPSPLIHATGVLLGDTIYLFGGQKEKELTSATDEVLALNLADEEAKWTIASHIPGGRRALAQSFVQHDGTGTKLYVFGGRRPGQDILEWEMLSDLWMFDPSEPPARQWKRRADSPVPLMAGSAIAYGQSHALIPGYSDGTVVRQWVESGQEMKDFKHPGFTLKAWWYHTITDTWVEADDIQANHVTTPAVEWQGSIVIANGEIMPRVRSPKVWHIKVIPAEREMGLLNLATLIIYLMAMVGVGVFFSFRMKSTDDYFRGGQRVPFIVAGLSIFATMLSSLTYVSLPAKIYATDWLYYSAQITIIPIAFIVVYIMIPFFRRIDATSAYEYLEKRFNRVVRMFASTLFILFHIGRMAVVMFLPALALSVFAPLVENPRESVAIWILFMGVLSVVYCTLGGVEAVVWTDAIQTVVLLLGIIVALLVVISALGDDLGPMVEAAYAEGKFHMADFDFSASSYTTAAIWVIIIGQLSQNLYSYGADQAVVQRYVTTADERGARKAMWTTTIMSIFGAVLFFILGTALYLFYRAHPQQLDPTVQTDGIFPLFIVTQLPMGIAGIVIAGIFAAAQSTISTSMNSTATAVVVDFLEPFNFLADDRASLRAARWATVLIGAFGTATAIVFAYADIKYLFDQFLSILGMFGGAVAGLFILGMLTVRTDGISAFIGAIVGTATVIFVGFWTGTSFFLYATVGIIVTVSVGYLLGLILSAKQKDLHGLTIFTTPR